MPKRKKRREETPDAPGFTNAELTKMARGAHIHLHEIYGADQVRHMPPAVQRSLGYEPFASR